MRGVSFGDYRKTFRGTIDSESLNENFKDIHEDLSEAYRREQYINNKVVEYASDLNYQNQQLNNRVNELENALVAASGHYASSTGNLLYWSAYSSAEVSASNSRQDLGTGDVVLPWSRSWTKIPLVENEYGDYEAAGSIAIKYNDGAAVYKSKPHDIYDAVDQNPETNWVHTYPIVGSPDSVTLTVELPASTNPSINSIYVAPFPEGGPSISNIRYLTSDGTWTQVSNFTAHDSRRRHYFTTVSYNNQVEVTVTPGTLMHPTVGQVRIFGIQNIDVGLIEYVSESSFVVRLDAADGTTITNLTYVYLDYSISPTPNETGIPDTSRPVVLQVYEDSGLTTLAYSNLQSAHSFSGSRALATPGSSVWAKVTLRKINSTTPVIRALTIRYN